MQTPTNRASRASAPPACMACRRRKSRCKFDGFSPECLMCRTHQTECVMPRHSSSREHLQRRRALPRSAMPEASITTQGSMPLAPAIGPQISPLLPSVNPGVIDQADSVAPTLEATEEDNPHIVGPATAGDSHFLEDYLSSIQDGHTRAIRPALPGGSSEPVVFMRVKKKPLGLEFEPDPSAAKLQAILKLLEPWQDKVLDLYFSRGNKCFPILDEEAFRSHNSLSRISPAVLGCLYAHAMCYWSYDSSLVQQYRPDGRYIWNIALQILYTELHISPGMSTISAILLNIGGRPTTTMVGNGMLLGSAISLAQSMGLNRNPQSWNIREREKVLRVNIWWCLVIHDRWTSLTYGTPPHIRQSYSNVPLPQSQTDDRSSEMFAALASLTNVVGAYTEQLYSKEAPLAEGEAITKLEAWTDTLVGEQRRIVIRGTNLDKSGAANLRMCYLAARYYMYRVESSAEMNSIVAGQSLSDRLLRVRRTVEEIVLFVHELNDKQLGDFWLPTMTFVFSSTMAFLLRVAVQIELPVCDVPSQSLSLSLAHDLITSLRFHQSLHGWELGDICLSQYGDVVDRLWAQNATDIVPAWTDAPFILDPGFYEPIDINGWDPLT